MLLTVLSDTSRFSLIKRSWQGRHFCRSYFNRNLSSQKIRYFLQQFSRIPQNLLSTCSSNRFLPVCDDVTVTQTTVTHFRSDIGQGTIIDCHLYIKDLFFQLTESLLCFSHCLNIFSQAPPPRLAMIRFKHLTKPSVAWSDNNSIWTALVKLLAKSSICALTSLVFDILCVVGPV